jgi:hypothetical protein
MINVGSYEVPEARHPPDRAYALSGDGAVGPVQLPPVAEVLFGAPVGHLDHGDRHGPEDPLHHRQVLQVLVRLKEGVALEGETSFNERGQARAWAKLFALGKIGTCGSNEDTKSVAEPFDRR